ncbi:MAG: type I toxin-antitoxin system antitoxin YafN [Gammaproteobacteria bacterium]|nr:MAG: type I toxin-antitoxin system antitoxin YafN [Gammaproteobacteria bacterium]
MATQTLLTDETVSMTDFRKHPAEYFGDKPVAVLSNNKPTGYVIGAALFEQLMALLEQAAPEVRAQFNPSASRLAAIAARGAELLAHASDEQLGEFTEV